MSRPGASVFTPHSLRPRRQRSLLECRDRGVDTRKVQELLGRRAREDDANLQPGGLLMPTETYQQLLIETVLQPPRN